MTWSHAESTEATAERGETVPGEPARVLMVLLTDPEETFDALVEAAAPIRRSIRFG